MSTFSSIVCRQQANTLLEIRDFMLLRRMDFTESHRILIVVLNTIQSTEHFAKF